MKRVLFLLFTFSIISTNVFAVEIGGSISLSNIDFAGDRTKTETEMSGTDFLYGLSVFGNADVSQDMSLETGLYYDPILRYTVSALLSYRSDNFRLKAGPFFGVLNDFSTILKTGNIDRNSY